MLERLRELLAAGWLVWSNEHNAWWGPNNAGYYVDVTAAGRYSYEAALEIERRADHRHQLLTERDWRDGVPPEIAVPSPELAEAWENALPLLLDVVEAGELDSHAGMPGSRLAKALSALRALAGEGGGA